MPVTYSERVQIINTMLEIIWGLALWKIVTTTVDRLQYPKAHTIAIYTIIFLAVTLVIYFYNDGKLTPLHSV